MVSGVAIRKLLDTLGLKSVDDLMAGVSQNPNPHGVTTFPFFNDAATANAYAKATGLDGYDAPQVWSPLPEGGIRPVDNLAMGPGDEDPMLPFTDDIFGLPFATKSGGDATNALKRLLENNLGKQVTPELFEKAEREGGLPYALGEKRAPFLQNPEPQYHATKAPERFSRFDPRMTKDSGQAVFDRVGTHMGTEQAAMERGVGVGAQHTRELLLDTSKPLTPTEALAFAQTYPVGSRASRDMLASAERAVAENPDVWHREGEANNFLRLMRNEAANQATAPEFGEKLGTDFGFTNIPYRNEVEDKGSVSNIALTERGGRDAVLRDVAAWNHPQLKHLPNLMAGIGAPVGLTFGAAALPGGQADAAAAPPEDLQTKLLGSINDFVANAPKREPGGPVTGGYAEGDPRNAPSILDLMPAPAPEAAPDTRNLRDRAAAGIDEALNYYLGGTGIPERLALAMPNPVGSLQDSMVASGEAFAPGKTALERVGSAGEALSSLGMAGLEAFPMGATGRSMGRALADTGEDALKAFAGDELGAIARDPRMWWQGSNIKLEMPLADMSATVSPTGALVPEKPFSIEDWEGKATLIPAFGDRTAAGGVLEALNGQPLTSPVRLEGGADFMREPDTGIWASERKALAPKAKAARDIAERGDTPILAYTSMAAPSGDFSTMMTDAVMGQFDPSKITKEGAEAFDKLMREGTPDTIVDGVRKPVDAEWPGILSPGAHDRLRGLSGTNRRAAMLAMESAAMRKAGFPSIAAARFGITDPRLVHANPFDTGLTMGAVDPTGKMLGPGELGNLRAHKSYDTQLAGDYLGKLGTGRIPGELIWRDFFNERRAKGAKTGSDQRSFMMSPTTQRVDAQMVDSIMRWLEANQP